jgi:hypothetical protein
MQVSKNLLNLVPLKAIWHTSRYTYNKVTLTNITGKANLQEKCHDCHPSPTYSPGFAPFYFPLYSRLKIRHFYRTEVIEVESQTVLNILTKHDLQDAMRE